MDGAIQTRHITRQFVCKFDASLLHNIFATLNLSLDCDEFSITASSDLSFGKIDFLDCYTDSLHDDSFVSSGCLDLWKQM